eukprot:gnl/TRDRNA2_/TRDRNA2_153660_c0_seq1.p1 gnl/TRDRNA2_/TRDRNA2_153660_c0~~gnl/TRDRNA2_/TRDRNA2_153660_c0_seq1.p1  ORF type:complete len:212 (-),score=44.88 gnl/TRDRNA2_/TRDRNA2_153660_c0_seq1:44-619(-)
MVCAALGACVVLTDVPEMIELLDKNIAANFAGEGDFAGLDSGTARSAGLSWDAAAAEALVTKEGSPFELVLCCDCVYEPLYGESWRSLVETVEALCRGPETTALVSLQRRGSEGIDGVDRFLERLGQNLEVEKLCTREFECTATEVFNREGSVTIEVFAARCTTSDASLRQPQELQSDAATGPYQRPNAAK